MTHDDSAPTPDLIIVNARIATGDSRRPWVTGLAIRNGTLTTLSNSAELIKAATPSSTIVDANGRELTLPLGVAVGGHIRATVAKNGDISLDT